MEETGKNGNLQGDGPVLPDKEIVRQAKAANFKHTKFWMLVHHLRFPYRNIGGQLMEATYLEVIKSFAGRLPEILFWLTDNEVKTANEHPGKLLDVLSNAAIEKNKLIDSH